MDSSRAKFKNSAQMSYLTKAKKGTPFIPLTSLELLKEYGTKGKRFNEENLNEKSSDTPSNTSSSKALSTDSIMKLARASLHLLNSQKADVLSIISSRFGAKSNLPSTGPDELELAILFQASAQKVANREFECARKFLSLCDQSASMNGSPVQRIVYYFSEALRERIDRELGKVSSGMEGMFTKPPMDVRQTLICLHPAMMAIQQELPFSLITQLTGMQSILDSVESAKRVHLIDFGLNNGSHWTIIMQALASRYECPVDLLKITAVGTSKEMMKETGRWLSSFAETLNLSISFKIVLSDLKDLKEDLFEIETDETVAVYMPLRLWSVLAWPNQLEVLLQVIKNLKPCVMLVKELESSINSQNFMDRFTEALFLCSALFDCFKVCMDNHPSRRQSEQVYLRQMIQNFITREGTERIHRHERIDFWRSVFARFGIVETELGYSSLCQAKLLLKRSAHWSSCTLKVDGKCLILGWNETPIQSLSAWKFQ